ncbi:hypothetical protein Lser_V15G36306 [Lactuca serriola]
MTSSSSNFTTSSMIYSSSTFPTPPSSLSWNYDVFLSFRGKDTRKTFVDHLYSALVQQGIYAYKDDETLPRGESIGPTLMKAIEESQIAVIIFSKNYANSSWCLDEVSYIMKCKDTRGQTVMPIFYDVDPSEVRKQKRKYKEAFSKHEFEDNKVESWRKALVDASNLSGWEPKHIANGHESKGIKQIVDEISAKLHFVTSSENENLIGIAARMQRLSLELQIGSNDVRMIGIWGVGGGGKTTLATSIYDQICCKFDGCCFVENIREESSRYGLRKLQEKMISEMESNQVGGGRRLISHRFRHRKVLIVLDDVDRLEQLKALVGSHDWFGEGSRIIITTRDEHVLNAHRVDVTHNISLLTDDEAIKLLRKHAPLNYRPMKDYEQLSKEVVSYAGGLPLAVTVLGSFLCDKNIHEWRSALARLKEIPNYDILEKLKVSFDGLAPIEKELFLDIACFFRWQKKDKAMEILDACGVHPVIGVKVLIQKALISISEDGMFDMHDLVQEMGHYIVRGEHPKNPEKHTRVWKKEDVLNICAMDAMTLMENDKIEAITFNYDRLPEKEQDLPLIATSMKNLRYIESRVKQANPLFNNFPPKDLCCLILHEGLQQKLWEGCKLLPNLKIMKLCGLENLIMTPDFDGLPYLERLTLHECPCLEEIHPSIGSLERLVFLSIVFCVRLKMCPPITRPKKLETLSFAWCSKLVNISEIQQQNMVNIGHLDLDKSGSEVASYLECCLPHNTNHIGLRFFHNLQELGLRKLDLSRCNLGDENIGSHVLELPVLQELNLYGNKFSRLNFSRLRLPRLKWLNLSWCEELLVLSHLPSTISVVITDHCSSLETFGDISNCKWLWKLSHYGGYNIDYFDGEILLDIMLQGKAIEDHFISVILPHQTPKGFIGRFFLGKTFTRRIRHVKTGSNRVLLRPDSDMFTLCLPCGWNNDFCGFLIRVVSNGISMDIDIIITQESEPDEEDSRFEIWQDSDELPEPEYGGKVKTYVGYVSFSSMMQTISLNSSHNIISFSIKSYWTSFAVELVPRKSQYDQVQTTKVSTNCSEYWGENDAYGRCFTTQHDSKSSIKILWRPLSL